MLSQVTKAAHEGAVQGHPSVMKLYDAIDTQRQLYLVVEACEGQPLNTVVREYGNQGIIGSRKNLTEEVSIKIIRQIISGLNHCHKLNISHRDIKLDNVLVDMKSDNIQTKIIDFGFAT